MRELVYYSTLSWNWENQLAGFQQTGQPAYGYVYDGLGRRVEKTENGAVTATFLCNPLGDLSSELDGSVYTDFIYAPASVPVTGVAPAGEARIAAIMGAGASSVNYFHPNPLGTTRVVTDANGNNVASCGQNASYPNGSFLEYTPYGNQLPGGCAQSTTPFKFGGKYQDAESGQEDFSTRYDRGFIGRFLSPDPSHAWAIRMINPQRWNRYSFGINNPTSFTDPTSEDAIAVDFGSMAFRYGHEGIISLHADGSATYADFGPATSDIPLWRGKVAATQNLPRVEFVNGAPTAASLSALVSRVAKIEGVDPSTIRLNYFKTSEAETLALDSWIQNAKAQSDSARGPFCLYVALGNNCANFAEAGLEAGGAITPGQVADLNWRQSSIPNSLYPSLKSFASFSVDEFDLQRLEEQCPNATVTTHDSLGDFSTTTTSGCR